MPTLRRKVAARRSRPARARRAFGQLLLFRCVPPTCSARPPRSSDAVPVHSVRVVIQRDPAGCRKSPGLVGRPPEKRRQACKKLPVLPVPVIEIARRKENGTMQVDDAPAVTPTDLDRSCARMLHAQARLRLRPCQSGPRHEGAVQEFLAGVSLKRDGQAQRVRTRLRSGPAVVSGPCRGALFGLCWACRMAASSIF
jgi:hypothetical protein